MESHIVVKKRKDGREIWTSEVAHCVLHPDLADWLKDNLWKALCDLTAAAPSLIFTSMVQTIPIVGSALSLITDYGALKKTADQATQALKDIIKDANYSGAQSEELELFQDDTFDEILVELDAWSEDDLKGGSCQVISASGEEVDPPHRSKHNKHFVATYRLDPASMASGAYIFAFGAQDSGAIIFGNDVATVSQLTLKWRRPIKHQFPSNSLRYLLELVDPKSSPSLKAFASLVGEQPPVSLGKLLRRSQSEKWMRIDRKSLKFLWHNLGLFPNELSLDFLTEPLGVPLPKSIPLYDATEDRNTVLPELVTYLRQCKPDIACFCELWVKDERDWLRNAVRDVYPYDEKYNMYSYEGPIGDAPGHWSRFDGGLLLLSRFPIVEKKQRIYDTCSGEDCFAAKGILYASIAVSLHPEPYDIFITHTQSCPPKLYEKVPKWVSKIIDVGDGGSCEEKLETVQLDQLIDFIRTNRAAGHPCILMGDLNMNQEGSEIANRFDSKGLGKPVDVCGKYVPQNEDHSTTQSRKTLDYTFAWPDPSAGGARFVPLFSWASIINIKISDHKGLLYGFDAIIETG